MAIKIHSHESATNHHTASVASVVRSHGTTNPETLKNAMMVRHGMSAKDASEAVNAYKKGQQQRGTAYESQSQSAANRSERTKESQSEHASRSKREASSKNVETGKHGGRYYIGPSGNKVYVK